MASQSQLRVNFQKPVLAAFPASPLGEGREAWITELGKTIGKVIEHFFLFPVDTIQGLKSPGLALCSE